MDPRPGCRCKSDTKAFLTSDFLAVSNATVEMLKIFRKRRAEKNWCRIRQFISEKKDKFMQLAQLRSKLLEWYIFCFVLPVYPSINLLFSFALFFCIWSWNGTQWCSPSNCMHVVAELGAQHIRITPLPTVKILAHCGGTLAGCPKTAGLATSIFSLHMKLKWDAMMLAKQLHACSCRIGGAAHPHHMHSSHTAAKWNFSNFAQQ